MSRLFSHPLARAFAIFAAVVWLVSASQSEIHHLLVRHVVCPEHGEVSEVRGQGAGPHAVVDQGEHHPSLVAGVGHHPDHGCTNVLLVPDRAPLVVGAPRITRAAFLLTDPLSTPAAPRGPPLDYAPKTSPPLAAS